MTTSVVKHFDKAAEDYQAKWQRWPGSAIRGSESRAIFKLLGDISNQDILEVGCGSGFYTRLLLQNQVNHVWAVDYTQAMVDQLPQGPITPIQADATKLQLDQTFDKILSAGMLEFVPDPLAVLKNLSTLATPKGQLVLLIPVKNFLGYLYHFYHRSHNVSIQLFSDKDMTNLANQSGWQIKTSQRCGLFANALLLEKTDK